jgi:hypothetical protein
MTAYVILVILGLGGVAFLTHIWYGLFIAFRYFGSTRRPERHGVLVQWLNASGVGMFAGALLLGLLTAMHHRMQKRRVHISASLILEMVRVFPPEQHSKSVML